MSNILNHDRIIFDIKLNKDDYWDFHVCLDETSSINKEKCLITFIDTNDSECIWFDSLYSKKDFIWSDSVNNELTLNSIGYTGIDNGLISYDKYSITNKEFLNIFLNSSYNISSDDKRFILHKINGNNQVFSYDNDLTYDNDIQVMRLNGGFYQGFFKTDENYQILPHILDSEWNFEIELCKKDFNNNDYALNDKHSNNKGMFMYIGTRAENKWWKYYEGFNTKDVFEKSYISDYVVKDNDTNLSYIKTDEDNEDYFTSDYIKNDLDKAGNEYIADDYFASDINLDKEIEFKTAEGYDLYQPNIIEYKTNNKFITFNHGKDGLTVNDNDIDNIETIIYDVKHPDIGNYFLLFNHTCNGYTTETIDKLIEENNKKYNILDDLYNNAIGFQITDDGKIGYKFLIKDCETNYYKIESEFSFPNNIKIDEWYKINIRILPLSDKMRIMIFINNKLVLISKELPKFNFRKLNDLYSKQEGVPFNISIGGGTQGLCDTIDIDYMTPPQDVLPLEKEFAGTFIGYIRTFKFYNC